MPSDEPPSGIPLPKRSPSSISRADLARSANSFQLRAAGKPEILEKRERRQRAFVQVNREWVIAGLLLFLVVVVACGLWVAGRMRSDRVADTAAESDAATPAAPEKWHGPVPWEVAEEFVAAKTHEGRLKWVRNPEQVGPAMEAFFRDGPGASEKVKATWPTSSVASGDLLFEEYRVELESGRYRLLSVSVDPRGAKVDFECYARHGSVPWDDLLTGKAAEADEMRVILQEGGYHLHGFADERRWRHFKATSPDLPEALDLYVARAGPVEREFEEVGAAAFHATLSLRAVEDSWKNRQFEISAVKALSWAEPE